MTGSRAKEARLWQPCQHLIVDDSTIKLVLSKPFAYFIDGLASTTGLGQPWMQSPDSVKQFGDTVGDHPVGTGPFKFVEWVKGQKVVLAANRDYWGAPYPYLDTLTFVPIEDAATRVNALNAGRSISSEWSHRIRSRR